ncbi:MAG: hypothetical protein K0S41_3826 [Anaerocolumna sp.]|nr:hypothetical protein [Anaerocolumna sp.]
MLLGIYAIISVEEKYVPIKCININELSILPYEDTYTFQEVLKDMQHNNLISKEKINQFRTNNSQTSTLSNQEIRNAIFYMDPYTFTKDKLIGSNSYVLQPRIYLGFLYNDSTSSPTKIVSLDSPFIFTKTGDKCKFIGDIFYKLEAGNRFFVGINGDVYKTAKEVMEGSSISYETSSNDYLRNVAFDVKYYSAELQP